MKTMKTMDASPITDHRSPITIPTFPARPVNGGSLDVEGGRFAYMITGKWIAEPKFNGWRALVHIETGAMFNRHGERLSIENEFQPALNVLRVTLNAQAFKWADCEALERRHGIGRGCLIVLDVIPEPEFAAATYAERNDWLRIPALPPMAYTPDPAHFPLVSRVPAICDSYAPSWREDYMDAWRYLQECNNVITPNVPARSRFYEGIVNKRLDAPYPIQIRSDNQETPAWVKHRWEY